MPGDGKTVTNGVGASWDVAAEKLGEDRYCASYYCSLPVARANIVVV